jgi:GNAT superfamily N-acetyltransferase
MARANGLRHSGGMAILPKTPDSPHGVPPSYGSSRRPPGPQQPAGIPEPPERERVTLHDGRTLVLREIYAGDVLALQRGFASLSPEEVRMRFLHPITELPQDFARRLCDLDPASSVALVLIDPPDTPEREIRAVARAYIDPATLSAEFALVVQRHYTGQGLGTKLMRRLIDTCRERGAVEIWGDVLLENSAMLRLCQHLGFERHSTIGDPGMIQLRKTLV